MDITPYVESLRRDLMAAADSGGEELRSAAERLAFALDPAARLALMEAISQAAAEITTELPDGSVDVRLVGRDLDFTVQVTPPVAPAAAPAAAPADEVEDGDDALARVTLRLPESVKAKAETKAADAGQSLNTWLVQVVRNATRDHAISVDVDLSGVPFFGGGDPFSRGGKAGKRMSGWA